MGWLSGAWNFAKGVAKGVVNVLTTVFVGGLNYFVDLFLTWFNIEKKLRIAVVILRDEDGVPVVKDGDVIKPISYVETTLRERFNVKLLYYGEPVVQTLPFPAPTGALNVDCVGFWPSAFTNTFGVAGSYFNANLAGWNVIPLSLNFPITVFVVRRINGKVGCSLGGYSDYVTLGIDGVGADESTMMHEIGHCCSLVTHRASTSNLMHGDGNRINNLVTSWQRFVFRGSRHCTYW
jgi:hypothetical protein